VRSLLTIIVLQKSREREEHISASKNMQFTQTKNYSNTWLAQGLLGWPLGPKGLCLDVKKVHPFLSFIFEGRPTPKMNIKNSIIYLLKLFNFLFNTKNEEGANSS
jgi:hypothetical protein